MKWVYPEFLFALLVVLIPLIIHLFHFKRYKTVFFSSLRFLKFIEQQQKSARKLKYWLIFLCRALAFIALVCAFAQPFFPNEEEQKGGKTIIAVYVDNSFSMSRVGETGELISQARELAKSIVEDAPRKAEFVLLTNELSGAEKQGLTKAKFLDKIEKIQPTALARSSNDVMRWWEIWLEESKKNNSSIASTKLIYLSDFQKSTFGTIAKYSLPQTEIYPVQLTPVNTANLYIDTIWFDSPIHKLGTKQTIYVRLQNDGSVPVQTVDVNMRIGTINRDVFSDIPAFGSDTVELSYFENKAGNIKGSLKVNDRQMNQDDSYFFSYTVKSKSNVLVVNGSDASENVGIVYGLDDFYNVQSISQSQLSNTELEAIDLIAINGANLISSQEANVLSDFSRDGGSLLLIPGSNASVSGWNGLLSKIQLPLLGGIQSTGLAIRSLNYNDPFFNGVFERKPDQLNLPDVKKAYRLQTNSVTTAVSLLDFQNGSSFLSKGSGKYTCFLVAAPLNKEFSSFTSNQLFSTCLLRVAELSQKQAPYFLTIGEGSQYPVYGSKSEDAAVHLKKDAIDFIPMTYKKQKASFLSIQGLEAIRQLNAGNYQMVASNKTIGNLSLNYNRIESKIAALTAEEITRQFVQSGLKTQNVRDASGWTGASFLQLAQPLTYWKWCVIAGIIFLLLEMGLIYFWKNR